MLRLLTLLAAAGAAQETNPFRGDHGAMEAGRQTYLGACSACHGTDGEGGQGPSLVSGRQARLPDRQMFRSIKDGLPGTNMPGFPLPDDKIWQLAAYVRSLAAPAVSVRLGGNAQSGRAVFSGKGNCASCHMIRGSGGFLGPDLSNIGAARTVNQLRQSVLEPSARVEAGYRAVTAATKEGTRIEGIARNHNNYSVQVLDRDGRLHLIPQTRIRSVELRGESLMPADYVTRLSKTELEDLIAFLASLTSRVYEGEP